jgi:hypothetical protein
VNTSPAVASYGEPCARNSVLSCAVQVQVLQEPELPFKESCQMQKKLNNLVEDFFGKGQVLWPPT